MKLVDLSPMWIALPGRSQMGFTFECPHCVRFEVPRIRLSVALAEPLDGGPPFEIGPKGMSRTALYLALGGDLNHTRTNVDSDGYDLAEPPYGMVPPGWLWEHTGDSFENISVVPSLHDAAVRHWRGRITRGVCR